MNSTTFRFGTRSLAAYHILEVPIESVRKYSDSSAQKTPPLEKKT
jgi:hypothetical protein